jgi:hypothetical protein
VLILLTAICSEAGCGSSSGPVLLDWQSDPVFLEVAKRKSDQFRSRFVTGERTWFSVLADGVLKSVGFHQESPFNDEKRLGPGLSSRVSARRCCLGQ